MMAVSQEKNRTISQRHSPVFFDGDYGIYREENFIEMLAFERKRSDRSGKSFQLMMLTIFGISDLQSSHETMKKAVKVLSASSRDTDIKGWYKRASVVGVIFTETDTINTATLREMFYQRLRAHLNEAQIDALRISFHTYPDDESPAMTDNSEDFTFYHDYLETEQSKISPLKTPPAVMAGKGAY